MGCLVLRAGCRSVGRGRGFRRTSPLGVWSSDFRCRLFGRLGSPRYAESIRPFRLASKQILRVAAYSSAVNRPLHVPAPKHSGSTPTEEPDEYETQRQGSSIQHFHDKLLLIRDRLKVRLVHLVGSRWGPENREVGVADCPEFGFGFW